MLNKTIRTALIGAAAAVFSLSAFADTVDYTFTGAGTGTVNGTAFDGTFTFTVVGNTANVTTSGDGFFRLFDLGGTFTDGTDTVTLSPTMTIVATASAGNPRINLFNATVDDGVGFQDSGFIGYELDAPFGPVSSGANSILLPTLGGGSFATNGGGSVAITGNTALTFSAELEAPSAVPEPPTFALVGAGMAAVGMLRRRFLS